MAWEPPVSELEDENHPQREEWQIEKLEDRKILGVPADDRGPALYDSGTRRVYRTELDRERGTIHPNEEDYWELEPEETLGEFLERLGDEVGWTSLSAFAQEHLEDGAEAEDGDGTEDGAEAEDGDGRKDDAAGSAVE